MAYGIRVFNAAFANNSYPEQVQPNYLTIGNDRNGEFPHCEVISNTYSYRHDPDFDDMSSFFPCEIDDVIQYVNLGYRAQAPKIVILLKLFEF